MKITNLTVSTENHQILKDINLDFSQGQIHYIFGPNGSGKSTLANVIMGHPSYEITRGSIIVGKEALNSLSPTTRALKGVYLSMQYPPAIHGVSIFTLIKNMLQAHGKELPLLSLRKEAITALEKVGLDKTMLDRSISDGLSGGEKKRLEIAQIALLQPDYVILDEPDSGLDIDGTRKVAKLLQEIHQEIGFTLVIITHYNRLLEFLPADTVTIIEKGHISKTGDQALAEHIMNQGFSYE
jgi:Fe-S cluster assembly ATP-binding protein